MSFDYFTSRLAPLASAAYQQKFGVRGTVTEYIVATELLQSAWECIERLEGRFPQAVALNAEAQSFAPQVKSELDHLAELLRSQESQVLEALPWPELMQNATWQRISLCARSTLEALGFDLGAWERSEMGEHRVP